MCEINTNNMNVKGYELTSLPDKYAPYLTPTDVRALSLITRHYPQLPEGIVNTAAEHLARGTWDQVPAVGYLATQEAMVA